MHFSNHNPWGWEGQLGRAQRTYNLHGGQFNTMLTTTTPPPHATCLCIYSMWVLKCPPHCQKMNARRYWLYVWSRRPKLVGLVNERFDS